jgi:tRNA threonylcarbamoyladenosine biosynthesis protein TsaB
MKYLLHIETSTKVCSVALSLDGKLIRVKESNELEYSHGENLTLFIASVLEDSKVSLNDLAAISVASGPGSYTGLRIGVSTAKGLCYALGIPLIAVDTLFSLAQLAHDKHPDVNLCPVIDARRMEVFNAIYTFSLETLKVISADVIDENSYQEFEPFVYFGDGAAKLQEIWKDRNCQIDTSILASAIGQIPLATLKFQNNEVEDVAYFEPFYLKDFFTPQKP